MTHYLVITDQNSRQYPIQIPEQGLTITHSTGEFLITADDKSTLNLFLQLGIGQIIVGDDLFVNLNHIVAIKHQEIADE